MTMRSFLEQYNNILLESPWHGVQFMLDQFDCFAIIVFVHPEHEYARILDWMVNSLVIFLMFGRRKWKILLLNSADRASEPSLFFCNLLHYEDVFEVVISPPTAFSLVYIRLL
jgi:hypothetical protein